MPTIGEWCAQADHGQLVHTLNQGEGMRTIAVCTAKGGSGKTTLALHLAVASVQQGRNVAVVDLDPQLTAVNWSQRRSSRDPVVAVMACSVSRVGAELERVAGLGADVVYLDTPPRAWVGADNAALAAAKLAPPPRAGRGRVHYRAAVDRGRNRTAVSVPPEGGGRSLAPVALVNVRVVAIR